MNQVGINYGEATALSPAETPAATSEPSAKSLGKAIGDARRASDLTQQELCAKADLSYSTLAKIERGAIKTPSVFTVMAIASAVGTTVESLLTGKPAALHSNQQPTAKDYKTSKSGIQFLYCDINGVLVRFFHRAFSKLAQDTDASATAIESGFWHYNDAVCRGEMSISDFNSALARHIGVGSIDWQSYYMDSIDPIREVWELLAWAKEHYRIGLLSNIMPGFIDYMLAHDLLPKLDYDVILDSSKVGAIKPEPHIYELATQQADVPPEAILFLDDSRTNLMAAERTGWQVMWFDDFLPAESVARARDALQF